MLGGLIAANSSTILTHLNWGASYLVHDFYRRFIEPRRRREALRAGRALRDGAAVRRAPRRWSSRSTPRRTASTCILQIGAGTGLLYLVRWFWWRVTAWCEIVAMVSSFAVSVVFLVLRQATA